MESNTLPRDPVRVDWRNLAQWAELDPARVTVPTLILQGEHDPYVSDVRQAELFTGLGSADREWVTLAVSDHAAHLENTRPRFIQALVSFLRRP